MAKAKSSTTTAKTVKTVTKPKTIAGKSAPAGKPQVVITLSHDEIARRAYDIWMQKGRPMGQDALTWHEAEQQLRDSSK